MKKSILISFVMLLSMVSMAQQTSVLFLGNSYIYTQNLPNTLYSLALAGGDTIYHESNTPGGHTLEGHAINATSLNKIASRNWDFVVLQEQSQRPSFSPSQVAWQVYPYAEVLVDSIKSNYACSEPVFFMTWGRRDGDQSNCGNYPPLCTFEGMNARLRESYVEMAFDNEATVAPCGAAWYEMSVANNSFWNGLYSGDGSHPSAWGTYLNACVFYATILRKSPVGIPFYSTIGQQDAEVLQQLAEDMVLDSLSTWNIGHADVDALASYEWSNGMTFNFENESVNATEHFWDFGDGDTSDMENPQHAYTSTSSYTVTYIASNECDTDTTEMTVVVNQPNAIAQNENLSSIRFRQTANSIAIENPSSANIQLQVIDTAGRSHYATTISALGKLELETGLKSGIYLLRLSTENAIRTIKIIIT